MLKVTILKTKTKQNKSPKNMQGNFVGGDGYIYFLAVAMGPWLFEHRYANLAHCIIKCVHLSKAVSSNKIKALYTRIALTVL